MLSFNFPPADLHAYIPTDLAAHVLLVFTPASLPTSLPVAALTTLVSLVYNKTGAPTVYTEL